MENFKYKILVLSDLNKSASTTLKSSVSLANMINAKIELFHVKEHIDIINTDNQLSAMRILNEEKNNTKKEIEALVNPVSKTYNRTIDYNFSFGNIKDEISDYIKTSKPDIIVLGQRDSPPFQLIGDSITRFVLKKFNGVIMISSNENALVPNEKMSLGLLNGSNSIFDNEFSKDLITHTTAPLKSFKIINSQKERDDNASINGEKLVEYVFEQNDSAMTTLSSYLIKNKINLLYVDRAKNKTTNSTQTPLKEVVSKLNVSLLVSRA
ncbi:universal stress protein [Winogradskyella schleiferi]|uniref:universal stress protein n=1 Tax=Winogradskyella schleiferi TaxID=2686078 RepID=UPI0015BFE1CE|nr:universal stress protein [Winogradskyella schleiferi]